MKYFLLLIVTACLIAACNESPQEPDMNFLTEDYVRLALEVGQYNDDFVDAYYGPEDWRPTGEKADSLPAEEFLSSVTKLMDQADAVATNGSSELEIARLNLFKKQLLAVKTKLEMMNVKIYPFDEEAKLLYDAEPPHYSQAHFDTLLADLDVALPGEGTISERYQDFIKQFSIPKDKLDTVFKTAIAEARYRTSQYIDLPENENFKLEYVTDKSWSGYNYYQGNGQSLIQINVDYPIYLQRAIDLAAHEGYPGHHVYNALLEQRLVDSLGWKEFSVYPLFSPQSLIAEGSANYGIQVAFPGKERTRFVKERLCPLAGIDTSKIDQYYHVLALVDKLDYAGNEAARKYLNGEISREEAAAWLQKYALMTPDRAIQRTRFFDQYRTYVINYNLGQDLVAKYIESKGGTADNPEKRWSIFKELLSNPHSASSLK